MRSAEGQLSSVTAEESSVKKHSNAFPPAVALSDTSKLFETWLKDLKPAFELSEAAPLRSTSGNTDHSSSQSDVRLEGMLRLDCYVAGRLRSLTGTLVVGENAEVEADISVAVAIVEGHVVGNIQATERVELGSRASVIGNIEAPALSIS